MQIKTVKDYYEQICKHYPGVPEKDIARILKFGWNSIYMHNVYGGDTLLKDDNINKYLFLIGKLTLDPLKHFYYYVKKLVIKIRVLYNRAKIPWDGYYYFALTDKQYEDFLAQHKAVGRKRKIFTFPEYTMLYKIFAECKVAQYNRKYFFKIPMTVDIGYKYLYKNLKTDKAKFLCELEANGFNTLYR